MEKRRSKNGKEMMRKTLACGMGKVSVYLSFCCLFICGILMDMRCSMEKRGQRKTKRRRTEDGVKNEEEDEGGEEERGWKE